MTAAKLTHAACRGVVFSDANLTGADFSGAHLDDADLTASRLDGANLREAHLDGTSLSWPSLRRAQFTPNCLVGAILVGELPGDPGIRLPSSGRIDADTAAILWRSRERESETA